MCYQDTYYLTVFRDKYLCSWIWRKHFASGHQVESLWLTNLRISGSTWHNAKKNSLKCLTRFAHIIISFGNLLRFGSLNNCGAKRIQCTFTIHWLKFVRILWINIKFQQEPFLGFLDGEISVTIEIFSCIPLAVFQLFDNLKKNIENWLKCFMNDEKWQKIGRIKKLGCHFDTNKNALWILRFKMF